MIFHCHISYLPYICTFIIQSQPCLYFFYSSLYLEQIMKCWWPKHVYSAPKMLKKRVYIIQKSFLMMKLAYPLKSMAMKSDIPCLAYSSYMYNHLFSQHKCSWISLSCCCARSVLDDDLTRYLGKFIPQKYLHL